MTTVSVTIFKLTIRLPDNRLLKIQIGNFFYDDVL